jgi:hypothetical protein
VVDHGGANLFGMSMWHYDALLSNLFKKKKEHVKNIGGTKSKEKHQLK